MSTDPRADVVVVGAGHNGLVAANYLADAGLRTVVLEAGERIGGMTSSGCTIPGAPGHVANHCAVDAIFWSAYPPSRDLELERHGLRWITADPPLAYLHPDGESLALWRDPRRTAAEIRRFSRDDADAYLELARFLDGMFEVGIPFSATNPTRPSPMALLRSGAAAARHRKDVSAYLGFLLAPAADVIDERFTHPVTRAALHSIAGLIGPASQPNTTLAFLTLVVMHRLPTLRPAGGTQAIPDALARRLRTRGGTILTAARVAEITVTAGRASGVVLTDGRRFAAPRGVLATCDPKQLLTQLVPASTLADDIRRRAAAIPTSQGGHGMLKIDVACSTPLRLRRHQRGRRDDLDLRHPSHLIGNPDGLERAFAAAKAGMLPDVGDLGFWNAIPSALDPTQAPPGQDSLYLWTTQVPLDPADPGRVDGYAADLVAALAEIYEGLVDAEVGRTVETARDLEQRVGATDGGLAHVDFALNRMGPLRPARGLGGYRMPVQGLFLGGSGASPGGGVTGMPGYLASRELLRSASWRSRAARSPLAVAVFTDDTDQ